MSRGLLSMFAGGDPWKVNETLQSGRPTQIGDMAHEADPVFNNARKRLDAWVRDNGQHPITNSPDVQRTIDGLHLQADQLPRIAADLETIAAALAQSQGTAAGYTSTLDARLGWRIEQSQAAPWINQPGGGMQYRILDENGNTGNVANLEKWGSLKRIGRWRTLLD